MEPQNRFQPWTTHPSHLSHAHHPFHIISLLWNLDWKQLPPGAHGTMWLELTNYSTLALLTIGLLISAIRLITLAIHNRAECKVQLPANTTEPDTTATRKEAFARSLIGNLDHGLGEDGDPLDIDAFWRSVSFPHQSS